MANISEALTKEFGSQKTVYLKGNKSVVLTIRSGEKTFVNGTFLMRKNNQVVFIHHLPGYKSQIDFLDSPTYFGEEHESKEMIPCTKEEYMEAFNEALTVINSKL